MTQTEAQRLLERALVAGLIGGLVGSAAKLIGEALYPPRTQGQDAPPAVLAQKIVGRSLSSTEKAVAAQMFHWTTGTLLGGVYGVVAHFVPCATIGFGVPFGIAVLLGTHESTLPLLGLDKPPTQQPLREHSSELATHALYGFAVEFARRRMMRAQKGG